MTITAAQCRGARGLLEMSQAELASTSGVSLRTIANFENGHTQLIPANVAALRRALEKAGVEFIDANGGGPGIRLRKGGTPARSKK
jgi:transcriptional regulator with XRE-family HTH domain